MKLPYSYERLFELAYQANKNEADYLLTQIINEERKKVEVYVDHLYEKSSYYTDSSQIREKEEDCRATLRNFEFAQCSLRLK